MPSDQYTLIDKFEDDYQPSAMRASSSIEEEELGIALDDKGLLQEPRRRHHREDHFEQPELVRDCILGLSDGLTVPFALAAGLSSLDNTKIVIYGGVAGKYNVCVLEQRPSLANYRMFRAGLWGIVDGFGWVPGCSI
jgi:hypothetical protein